MCVQKCLERSFNSQLILPFVDIKGEGCDCQTLPTVFPCAVVELSRLENTTKNTVKFVVGTPSLEASLQEQGLYKNCLIYGEGNFTSVPPS